MRGVRGTGVMAVLLDLSLGIAVVF